MVSGQETEWDRALSRAEELIKSSLKRPGPEALALLMAPMASNEDAYVALHLFRDTLKFPNLGYDIPSAEKLKADHLLLTDDPYPNRRGFKDLSFGSFSNRWEAAEIVEAVLNGSIKGLILSGTDLEGMLGRQVETLLSRLDWLILVSSHRNLLWEKATVALPMAVYAERTGTFTNFRGLVQKFEKAVEPLGEALPQWEIWQRLGKRMGAKWSFDDVHEVFKELAEGKPEYDTLNWQATFGIGKGAYPDNW